MMARHGLLLWDWVMRTGIADSSWFAKRVSKNFLGRCLITSPGSPSPARGAGGSNLLRRLSPAALLCLCAGQRLNQHSPDCIAWGVHSEQDRWCRCRVNGRGRWKIASGLKARSHDDQGNVRIVGVWRAVSGRDWIFEQIFKRLLHDYQVSAAARIETVQGAPFNRIGGRNGAVQKLGAREAAGYARHSQGCAAGDLLDLFEFHTVALDSRDIVVDIAIRQPIFCLDLVAVFQNVVRGRIRRPLCRVVTAADAGTNRGQDIGVLDAASA